MFSLALIHGTLTHPSNIADRFHYLNTFLGRLDYLYLHADEYEDGLSNGYTLNAELKDIIYSVETLSSGKTMRDTLSLAVLNNTIELTKYYVSAYDHTVSGSAEISAENDTDLVAKVRAAFEDLVAYDNGLEHATAEERETFFALSGANLPRR